MTKFICNTEGCINKGKYCRLHLTDVEPEQTTKEQNYLKVRAAYLKEHPVCGFKGCKKPAVEVHHKRGRIGKLLTDIRHFLGLCRAHHAWVEAHPHAAKEQNYSESRLKKEATA